MIKSDQKWTRAQKEVEEE